MQQVQQLSNQESNTGGGGGNYQHQDSQNLQRTTSIENSFQRTAGQRQAQNQSSMNMGQGGSNNNTHNINVVIRIRPCTNTYQQNNTINNTISNISGINGQSISYNIGKCIQDIKEKKTILMPNGPKATEMFTYDFVGDEDCQQDEIFKVAARPIVDQCLLGYNGTIFAYGQTGSGKTHTILGDKRSYEVLNQIDENLMNVDQIMNSSNNRSFSLQSSQTSSHISHHQIPTLDKSQAGILPRSFEYLFQQIQRIKAQYSQKSERNNRKSARKSIAPSHANLPTFQENCVRVEFDIKCQFIEIYNENVFDLLDTTIDRSLTIRQDIDKGTYVDGGRQEVVQNLQDVMRLVVKGNLNRSIASTQMNRESSRSHAVFITHIKTIEILENGKQNAKISRFYIVDLAGSERCKDTGAEGIRLKEASNINKSLSVLGNVINKLSENSKYADTKPKAHVNYRDSKLTYLLQDSLGGNAKTVIICNVNPHIQAMKETRNTLQFAQRAKMIQNQAVINEDTNCVEFWKIKYQQLERQVTRTGGNNTLSKTNTLSKFIDQTMNECDFVCGKCQGQETKRGGKDNCKSEDQKDYEKMNIDALRTIKEYSLQLKELRDQANINSIDVKKSIDSALSFKTSVKLQTELANTRSNKMKLEFEKLINLRKIQDPNHEIYSQELMAQIDCMKVLIDSQQQEIEKLKKDLESHPMLALRCCQVIDMEKRIKEYQEQLEQFNGGNSIKDSIDNKINTILDEVNRLIAKSENLYNSKKIDRMNQDVSGFVGDIEMLDTTRSNPGANNNNLQLSQIVDFTMINQRRDQELANIKLQYEEQLETMRVQLKKEQENVRRLKSFLTQSNAGQSQYTFGDEMLQNSQISSIFQINRGQTQLMESQRLVQSQFLQVSNQNDSNINNPFMQTMHLPHTQSNQLTNLLQSNNNNNNHTNNNQDIILEEEQQNEDETSQQQQLQTQMLQQSLLDIAEFEKLINDCQLEIQQLRDDNSNLHSQNQQLHQMIDEHTQSLQELTQKYDEAVSAKITLETDKLQIQSKIEELQAQIEQVELENKEFINEKVEYERLDNENQELKDKVTQLEEDLQNANNVNDYFANNVMPTLNKEIATISEQFQVLKLENQQLKDLKSNDPEKDQLQSEINTITSTLKQKENDIQRLHEALEKSLQSIDEQKEYIQSLNQKYQEEMQEYGVMKQKHEELIVQVKEMNELIDESQAALIANDKKYERLQKENNVLKYNFQQDEEKFKSKMKDTLTRLAEEEHKNKLLLKEVEKAKNDNTMLMSKCNELTRDQTELRAKYVTYKNMATKQMEQMQLTVDTVTKYRQSLGTKTEHNDQLIQKYRGEIEQLKEYLKKKELEAQGMAKKLQTLEEFRMRLIEKDKELKRVHDLEKEISNLRTELKIYETKCQQIEANFLLKESEHKKLQEQHEQLEKEFLDLSKLGDQARYQHLNKVRGQNNQYAKDLTALNQEMKNLKLESRGIYSLIIKFSKDVLNSLRLDNSRPILRANPETHLREYLGELLDVIGQGFTNLQLQLETPNNNNNGSFIRYTAAYEQEPNSLSEESSQIIDSVEAYQKQQQLLQQEQQQVPQQQQYKQNNNFGMKQNPQQFRQQQNNGVPLQNKNINLQALNQQTQQQRRPQTTNHDNSFTSQQQHNQQLDRSMEMKENQNNNNNNRAPQQNFANQMSNQKLTNGQRQFNASQQQQQQQPGIYQIHVPIQSNKFTQPLHNTQQHQQQMRVGNNNVQNGFQTQNIKQQQMIGKTGFAVPPNHQQQQRINQQQHNLQQQPLARQQSNNRDQSSNSRMDIS